MAERWIKAQEEVGDPEYVWWALVDTEHEGIRVRALGIALAAELVDGLNASSEAEEQPEGPG